MNPKTVDLYNNTRIETVWDVVSAYKWCVENFGAPGVDWSYSKSGDPNGIFGFISSPMEIEFLTFNNPEYATMFILKWS
jgi:hypothetical protein